MEVFVLIAFYFEGFLGEDDFTNKTEEERERYEEDILQYVSIYLSDLVCKKLNHSEYDIIIEQKFPNAVGLFIKSYNSAQDTVDKVYEQKGGSPQVCFAFSTSDHSSINLEYTALDTLDMDDVYIASSKKLESR